MGILDIVEEAAGAFGADKALEAVDPNAGLLARGAAAIAGFEGAKMIKNRLSDADDEGKQDDGATAQFDDGADASTDDPT